MSQVDVVEGKVNRWTVGEVGDNHGIYTGAVNVVEDPDMSAPANLEHHGAHEEQ